MLHESISHVPEKSFGLVAIDQFTQGFCHRRICLEVLDKESSGFCPCSFRVLICRAYYFCSSPNPSPTRAIAREEKRKTAAGVIRSNKGISRNLFG
jgi:hypothetical protein